MKSQNLDLVFDKSGMSLNGVPLLLYSRENTDFTNDIVTELNKPGRVSSVSTEKATSATTAAPAKKP